MRQAQLGSSLPAGLLSALALPHQVPSRAPRPSASQAGAPLAVADLVQPGFSPQRSNHCGPQCGAMLAAPLRSIPAKETADGLKSCSTAEVLHARLASHEPPLHVLCSIPRTPKDGLGAHASEVQQSPMAVMPTTHIGSAPTQTTEGLHRCVRRPFAIHPMRSSLAAL